MFSILGLGVVRFVVLNLVIVFYSVVLWNKAKYTGCRLEDIIEGGTKLTLIDRIKEDWKILVVCAIPYVGNLLVLYVIVRAVRKIRGISASDAEDMLRKMIVKKDK